MGRGASSVTKPLLEAVARAMGARRAYLIGAGTQLPPAGRAGFLGRLSDHLLVVDVPDSQPPQQLVCELPSPPSGEDRLVAEALARVFQPRPRGGQEQSSSRLWDPTAAVAALQVAPERRGEALLRVALVAARSRAGALTIAGPAPKVWTLGAPRSVLTRAASKVADTASGRIVVGGTEFLGVPLMAGGRLVGGLVAEGGTDGPAVRVCAALAGAVLGAPPEAVSTSDPGLAETTRAVLAAARVPMVAVDHEGRLLGASPEAEILFGLTDFDQGRPMHGRMGNLPLDSETPPSEALVGDRWMEVSTHPLPAGARLISFTDRALPSEARQSQVELVAAMSHELRTPIAGVKALLEVLRMLGADADPERTRGLLDDGIREVLRLERLVEDLLLSARIATGGITPHADEIELRPVADSIVTQLGPRYPDRSFTVEGTATAFADPSLVRHALWHLADNAAKFGPPDGEVQIRVSTRSEGPELTVTDRGPGIYSGDISNLFRRFHRVEGSAKSQHGGAGVGLYLVKSLVEAQGGRVWVRSRLGKGSTFGIELPPARK